MTMHRTRKYNTASTCVKTLSAFAAGAALLSGCIFEYPDDPFAIHGGPDSPYITLKLDLPEGTESGTAAKALCPGGLRVQSGQDENAARRSMQTNYGQTGRQTTDGLTEDSQAENRRAKDGRTKGGQTKDRRTESGWPGDGLPEVPGTGRENDVMSIRTFCFMYPSGEEDSYRTEKQVFADAEDLQEEDRTVLISGITAGRKKLVMLANEPDFSFDLGTVPDLAGLRALDINISSLNGKGAGESVLPMFATADEIDVGQAGETFVETGLNRSVAKVELVLKKNESYRDSKIVIRKGSSITLHNAMCMTSFVDRDYRSTEGLAELDSRYGLYADIAREVTQDIEITEERETVFTAYIGDYGNGDVSRLDLTVSWDFVATQDGPEGSGIHAGDVLDTKSHTIHVGNPDGSGKTANGHIYRNIIYRIEGTVSDFGNFSADIIDWNTLELIAELQGGTGGSPNGNANGTVFDWEDVDWSGIAIGSDGGSANGGTICRPEDWWGTSADVSADGSQDEDSGNGGNVMRPGEWTDKVNPGDTAGGSDGNDANTPDTETRPGDWDDHQNPENSAGGSSGEESDIPDTETRPGDWTGQENTGNTVGGSSGEGTEIPDTETRPGDWTDENNAGGQLDGSVKPEDNPTAA